MTDYKIKPLTKDQIIISIDRLTRFKNTQDKYLRVFRDILTHNLIQPKFNKHELLGMDFTTLKNIAQKILNLSIENLTGKKFENDRINKALFNYENSTFKLDVETLKLLKNEINYFGCLDFINEHSPKNLQWLKTLANPSSENSRQNLGLQFPIEKIILAEGATEETLLPIFAKLCDYDFDKNGVYIIAAGGKNQVVKFYYEFADTLKLPIYVLLDKDGQQNAKEIESKLRCGDIIHIIECGEFEDILSLKLVQRTIEYELKNISILEKDLLNTSGSRVKTLEEIFKTRGMHEFKKVEFARMIKNNIKSNDDITPEIRTIIDGIKNLNKNK